MITLARDAWGVPHIFAATQADLYYGFGHALAEDRLFQIDMARRAFTGRVAEVLGAEYLGHDQSVRANYEPAAIRTQLDALPAEEAAIFTSYAAGFNARLAEVLADPAHLLPAEYAHYDFAPTPLTDADVAMLWIGSLANRFSDTNSELLNLALLNDLEDQHGAEKARAIFDTLKWRNDPAAPTTIQPEDRPAGDIPRHYPRTTLRPLSPDARARVRREVDRRLRGQLPETASNIWILGPSRTTDGSTMLLNGPQFGWFAPAYVWGVGLHSPGWDVVGNTPYAYPCLLFATNGTIAWGSTAGPGKVVDLYQEHTDPADPLRYWHNGAWHRMTTRQETIAVRGAAPVTITIHATVHGHVVLTDPAQHTAYAKRRSWAGREVESLLGWVGIMHARDWEGFLAQCARIAISVNFYYADRAGNIGYALMGRYPNRPASQDTRLPSPGTGEMEWNGVHPFAWNPKVLNPKSGLVANWNNKVSPDHDNTDTYIWGAADRQSEILSRLTGQVSPEAMWAMVERTSFRDLNARALAPLILAAAPDHPAAAVLRDWDGGLGGEGEALLRDLLPRLVRAVFGADLPAREVAMYAASHPQPEPPPPYSHNINPGIKALSAMLSPTRPGLPRPHDFLHGATPESVIRAALDASAEALGPRPWVPPTLTTRFRSTDFMGIPMGLPSAQPELASHMNRGTENNLVRFSGATTTIEDVTPPGQSGFIAPDGTVAVHARDQLALYESFGRKPQLLDATAAMEGAVSWRELRRGE